MALPSHEGPPGSGASNRPFCLSVLRVTVAAHAPGRGARAVRLGHARNRTLHSTQVITLDLNLNARTRPKAAAGDSARWSTAWAGGRGRGDAWRAALAGSAGRWPGGWRTRSRVRRKAWGRMRACPWGQREAPTGFGRGAMPSVHGWKERPPGSTRAEKPWHT